MAAIDRKVVQHVAALANLRLDDREVESLTGELGRILDLVAQLSELDTSSVEPTAALPGASALRRDEGLPGLSQDEALDQAPRAGNGGFLVPGFLDAPRGR